MIGMHRGLAEPACPTGLKSTTVAELLFGRTMRGRLGVTEAKWARFLATEVTPRFPDGLTVYDAKGQWREPGGQRIARERSKVLMIILPGRADDQERLIQVIRAYKTQFQQKSVGLVLRPSCVSFDAG